MPPKSKSIFRQPGVQHFQVVHRSQRDPLIHDPEASQQVLKPFTRTNERGKPQGHGRTRAELEAALFASEEDKKNDRENLGEATLYGVYFDDTEYDYMQHLRPVGLHEEGVDSMWIEAPSTSSTAATGTSTKKKGKSKGSDFLSLKEELADVLPSEKELSMAAIIESHQAIPSSIAGLQPDMDPHLRQTLEALEDEAFVDEELQDGEEGDDFFDQLLGGGERDEGEEEPQFAFKEWGSDPDDDLEEEVEEMEVDEADWQARYAKFKKERKAAGRGDGDDDGSEDGLSEGRDTVGTLPKLAVVGGKRRRTGTSDGSGYSLRSSAVYRNEGLSTLDEKFEQLMSKEYGSGEEDEDDFNSEEEDTPPASNDDSDTAPDLIEREDFSTLVDDFLDNYEVVGGRKLRPILPGSTNIDKLQTMRDGLGEEAVQAVRDAVERQAKAKERPIPMPVEEGAREREDRWDCETILSTYSNLENHPKIIRARDLLAKSSSLSSNGPKIKITLDKKTGLPSVKEEVSTVEKVAVLKNPEDTDEEEDEEEDEDGSNQGYGVGRSQAIKRSATETKEEKKARKQAVKDEKQARRKEKKASKEAFASERKVQKKRMVDQAMVPMKKL